MKEQKEIIIFFFPQVAPENFDRPDFGDFFGAKKVGEKPEQVQQRRRRPEKTNNSNKL